MGIQNSESRSLDQPSIRPGLDIYYDPMFRLHDTGPEHPETPSRMDAALAGVDRAGANTLIRIPESEHPETARVIARVHSASYEKDLDEACGSGRRLFHSLDNPISSKTHAAARAVVSAALHAASDVWGERGARRAFVIARPPGHHALKGEAMGFCFFNTIACVAEQLLEREGIDRVFIFDWDVHHGNGTQQIFETRSDVFYASMHRYPFYPGTGAAEERGTGEGRGFTRNIPLEGSSGDAKYLEALERVVLPAIDEFRPHAILLSAGFDAHVRDPLGGMRVSERAFGTMTERIVEAAERHSEGKLLSLLEGGYDPEGLAASVAAHVNGLE